MLLPLKVKNAGANVCPVVSVSGSLRNSFALPGFAIATTDAFAIPANCEASLSASGALRCPAEPTIP
jgi:hypothetical protein